MKNVTVYTQTVCPYCTQAKNLLKGKNVTYSEINLDDRPDQEWQALQEKTGLRTLPQIYIGDELIGGFTELAKLERAGQLDEKLK